MKPRILGYRKNGAPIYEIRGAAPVASPPAPASAPTLEQLLAEARDVEQRLASPGADDNVPELVTRATEIAEAIDRHRADAAREATERAQAQAARNRLASLAGTGPPNSPAGTSTTPAGGLPAAAGLGIPGAPEGMADHPDIRTLARQFAVETHEHRQNGSHGQVAFELPGEIRALLDTTGWPVQPTRLPGVQTLTTRDRPLRMADLIDRQPLGTNVIEWVEETVLSSAAAETTEGSLKPETTITLAVKTGSAATIAHFLNLTRQAAQDDSQMEGYIRGRLLYGLNKRLDDQIASGTGTAPNLRGILNTAGIGTYVAGTGTEAALISIRKAVTTSQLSEYYPDTVVLNPVDWEAIELSTDTTGAFRVSPDVRSQIGPRIWGLNAVVSNVITGTVFGTTGGTFLVGSFMEGATLWERVGIQVYLTDSHASNFTSNILTLLAEFRAALTVWRPKAFVKGTFGASRT
jgi:HK97 family phage major capsid protein